MQSLKSNPHSHIFVGLLLLLFFLSQNELRSPFRFHSNHQMEERKDVHHGTTSSSSSRQNLGIHFAASHEEFEELLREEDMEDSYKNAISSMKSDDLAPLASEEVIDYHAEARTTKNSIDVPLSSDEEEIFALWVHYHQNRSSRRTNDDYYHFRQFNFARQCHCLWYCCLRKEIESNPETTYLMEIVC